MTKSLNRKSEEPMIDQIDAGLDLLNTAFLALMADRGFLDDDAISSVAATLQHAMNRLGPIREKINDEHGRDTLEYIRQIQEERVET
ncbi:MAG: hypothetical protein WDN46_12550 [Methylocella sp.]